MVSLASRTDDHAVRHVPRDAETAGVPSPLEPDDVYHLLQTRRRRDVLRYLHRADGPVQLRALAEQIAAWEAETTVENLTSSERQRVYISLYQTHLPKLDTHDVIDYDKDRGTIEATPLAAQLVPYLTGLEATTEHDPWPRRYATAVGGCGLLLTAIATGLVSIPWAIAAASITGLIAAVTTVHAYSVRWR
ncbi:DUF7344 domain-containing protein [Natronorubrum sulfidifaciens]|uniref:DUF7344 domain-containing protein n=1 Tax=Natronorubrum sulfidifaciens JCM 14089 TaxID=1230460 RepID=L9VZE0_9EURY|nr:hypothetical protein [Natronorubrum sulfidifaciens]ELY42545.1 hypothetical protein C495_14567 [Natronorubrum sulfidifaciens JCM 14089]